MMISVRRQRGIALPVMLVVLTVMLIGTIFLLKATNSTTLTTSNLAYQASLSKAADLGLLSGFAWLSSTSSTNKSALNNDDAANGYVSTFNTAQNSTMAAFWVGSRTIANDGAGNAIEYVVHRMCAYAGNYDNIGPPANTCVMTSAKSSLGTPMQMGESGASDAPAYNTTPQVHYVITSRIFGPRGGNVVNQLVVTIGA